MSSFHRVILIFVCVRNIDPQLRQHLWNDSSPWLICLSMAVKASSQTFSSRIFHKWYLRSDCSCWKRERRHGINAQYSWDKHAHTHRGGKETLNYRQRALISASLLPSYVAWRNPSVKQRKHSHQSQSFLRKQQNELSLNSAMVSRWWQTSPEFQHRRHNYIFSQLLRAGAGLCDACQYMAREVEQDSETSFGVLAGADGGLGCRRKRSRLTSLTSFTSICEGAPECRRRLFRMKGVSHSGGMMRPPD